MDQTTLPRPPVSVQPALYELLARSWAPGAAVTALCLDRTAGTVAAALADGRIALAALADTEPPDQRIRQEVDTGRVTIRPRAKPLPPLTLTEALEDGPVRIAPSGTLGFLVAGRFGQIFRVTPRGQVLRLLKGTRPVAALASDSQGRFAVAQDSGVTVHAEDDVRPLHSLPIACRPDGLLFLPDGTLAIAGNDGLTLWRPGTTVDSYPVGAEGPIMTNGHGDWLAGANRDGGLWLMRRATGEVAQLGNFPAPPRSVGFGAEAVFASGAFRIAGWSLTDVPFDAALRSGRTSLVLVECVAVHPQRALVAAGSADGTVVLAQPGQPDEMMLRHADGGAITALHWSPDGAHLVIGTATGEAAIVTFPPHMFK